MSDSPEEFTIPAYERKQNALIGVLTRVTNPDNHRPWEMNEQLERAISELREMLPSVPAAAQARVSALITYAESKIAWALEQHQKYWDSIPRTPDTTRPTQLERDAYWAARRRKNLGTE